MCLKNGELDSLGNRDDPPNSLQICEKQICAFGEPSPPRPFRVPSLCAHKILPMQSQPEKLSGSHRYVATRNPGRTLTFAVFCHGLVENKWPTCNVKVAPEATSQCRATWDWESHAGVVEVVGHVALSRSTAFPPNPAGTESFLEGTVLGPWEL